MTTVDGIGAALRSARRQRGVSLRALAGRLGIAPSTLSAIETGRSGLSVDRLSRIAAALDTTVGDLLTGTDDSPESESSHQSSVRSPAASAPMPMVSEKDWRAFPPLDLAPGLTAALHLFVERGFHAASMRDVAAAAHLSVAGLYHHHANKAAMLIELLDLTMDEIDWRMEAAEAEGGTPLERLARMIEALALFHALRGELAFLGASEMRGLPPPERARIRARRTAVQRRLEDGAEAAIRAGQLTTDDPSTACRAIATMCTALPTWFRPEGPLTAHEVARRYAQYGIALLAADDDLVW